LLCLQADLGLKSVFSAWDRRSFANAKQGVSGRCFPSCSLHLLSIPFSASSCCCSCCCSCPFLSTPHPSRTTIPPFSITETLKDSHPQTHPLFFLKPIIKRNFLLQETPPLPRNASSQITPRPQPRKPSPQQPSLPRHHPPPHLKNLLFPKTHFAPPKIRSSKQKTPPPLPIYQKTPLPFHLGSSHNISTMSRFFLSKAELRTQNPDPEHNNNRKKER